MKVIVFGATGTIGKHVVEQSLDQGHEVTAFSRNPDQLETSTQKGLTPFKGDVTNINDVQSAIVGHDLVCIVLGSGKQRKGTVRSEGTKNIIQSMKAVGVKRLICQTTLGCGDSNENLNFFWKRIMFGWFLKDVFLDHELQERFVSESGLDWTIVRPGAFKDGEKTGNYKHGFSSKDKTLQLKISRADVADFIVQQFDNEHYLHQRPGLSY